MSKEWSQTQTKSRGWWWKAPLIVISLLSLALLIIIININAIALSQINSALEKTLVSGGHLTTFELELLDGQLTLSELTLNAPEGFDTTPPLNMNHIKLSIEVASLFHSPIIINEITLDELAITVVRDKQGELNVLNLLPPADQEVTSAEDKNSNSSEPEPTHTDTEEPLAIPAIDIKKVAINHLTVEVIDHLIGETWSASVALDVNIDNIQLNDLMNRDILVDALYVGISKLNIDQLPGFSKAPLLTLDKVSLTANNLNLSATNIPLNNIELKGLALSVEQDSHRELNLQQLLSSWQTQAHQATNTSNTTVVETKPADTATPSITISNITLDSISAQLLSHVSPKPWRTGFEQLNIQLADLGIAQNSFTLDKAALTLNGFEIDQAPGFGDEKLLSLKQLSITTAPLSSAADELRIKEIALDTLASSIETDEQGLTNILALGNTLQGKPTAEETPQATASNTAATPESSSTQQQPIIHIEQIAINNSSLTYSDRALADTPMVFPLKNIEFEAKHLRVLDSDPEAAPASLSLALELTQPDSLPDAYFGAIAVMGPINTGIPAINSQVRLGGFKLDTIDPLIPPATRTTLGADGFDAAVAIALNHQDINLYASVLSDKNITYNAIAVKGPITAPAIEMGPILTGVYSRVSDGLLNLGKGSINAGLDIASSGVDIAQAVGTGTLSIGKNLGTSLFETGSGLITLDKEQLSHGLMGTSKGTLQIGYDSVTESGSAATGGLKGSYHSLDGSNAEQAWNEGIKTRYEHSMLQAEKALLQMRYPPEPK